MFSYRRLYSKSNTLHINLFFAFILRASMSCIRDILFVDGFGLSKDVKRGTNGGVTFIQEGSVSTRNVNQLIKQS